MCKSYNFHTCTGIKPWPLCSQIRIFRVVILVQHACSYFACLLHAYLHSKLFAISEIELSFRC